MDAEEDLCSLIKSNLARGCVRETSACHRVTALIIKVHPDCSVCFSACLFPSSLLPKLICWLKKLTPQGQSLPPSMGILKLGFLYPRLCKYILCEHECHWHFLRLLMERRKTSVGTTRKSLHFPRQSSLKMNLFTLLRTCLSDFMSWCSCSWIYGQCSWDTEEWRGAGEPLLWCDARFMIRSSENWDQKDT